MAADGQVVAALDEVQARTVIADLIDCGVESLAISLLHAYANPAHEHRLRELAAELAPAMAVSISSDVLPEFREYERTNVVVMERACAPDAAGVPRADAGRPVGSAYRRLSLDPAL